MSWGTTWGTYWGGGFSGIALQVLSAWPISERQLWVTVPLPPLAVSSIQPNDALNPASWHVVNSDTGQDLIVLGVQVISLNTFELYTLYKFGPLQQTHRVTASLRNAIDLSPSAVDLNFPGCYFSPEASVPGGMVDIANPYFAAGGNSIGGTLRVGSNGDYVKSSGVDLLRKLVIRRLTTTPNEFFHMDPASYGVGLKLKESPTATTMPAMRTMIINQLVKEPEFSSVDVQLSLSTTGILVIVIRAVLALTGEPVSIPIPASVQL
jgi:hypothetical protein